MSKYKISPGILLVKICDQYLLVSSLEARRNNSPYINQINETGAFIWNLMNNWITYEEIVNQVEKEYEVEDQGEINTVIDQYITELKSLNYLMEE